MSQIYERDTQNPPKKAILYALFKEKIQIKAVGFDEA